MSFVCVRLWYVCSIKGQTLFFHFGCIIPLRSTVYCLWLLLRGTGCKLNWVVQLKSTFTELAFICWHLIDIWFLSWKLDPLLRRIIFGRFLLSQRIGNWRDLKEMADQCINQWSLKKSKVKWEHIKNLIHISCLLFVLCLVL